MINNVSCCRAFLPVLLSFQFIIVSAQVQMGEGMVKPHIQVGTVLYLHLGVLKGDELDKKISPDSIVFKQGKYNIEIASAPPWFVPEIIKLDYEILQLRATTIARNWIEVIVNKQTGKKAWVERSAVDFMPWPEFLLNVAAIEVIDAIKNPLRIKPLDQAALAGKIKDLTLIPIAIQGDWIQVSISEPGDPIVASGWIRWRRANQLLINWSLLS